MFFNFNLREGGTKYNIQLLLYEMYCLYNTNIFTRQDLEPGI
jgi:hypothetical protein